MVGDTLAALGLIALVVLFVIKGMYKVPWEARRSEPASTKSSITAAMRTTVWATQSTAAVRPKWLMRASSSASLSCTTS